MPSVGDKFRAERERRGLTIHQAADGTNIKTDHIRAMEAGDWKSFPAPVYIRGFARTYAKFLRLDEKVIVEELGGELGDLNDFDGPGGGFGRKRGVLDFITLQFSRIRWAVAFPLLVGVILIVVGWVAFKIWQAAPQTDALDGLGSGLTQPRSNPQGTLPLPTNGPPVRTNR